MCSPWAGAPIPTTRRARAGCACGSTLPSKAGVTFRGSRRSGRTNVRIARGDDTMSELRDQDPAIFDAIAHERERQLSTLELIASENFASEAVLEAMGSVMTNKYAEGLPGRRHYGGCEFVDIPENLAIQRGTKLFGAEHPDVQAPSRPSAHLPAHLPPPRPRHTT